MNMNILLIEDSLAEAATHFGKWHLYKTDIQTEEDAVVFAKAMFDTDGNGLNGWDDVIPERGWNVEVIDCYDYHATEYEDIIEEIEERCTHSDGKHVTVFVGLDEVLDYLNLSYDRYYAESSMKGR